MYENVPLTDEVGSTIEQVARMMRLQPKSLISTFPDGPINTLSYEEVNIVSYRKGLS